MKYLVGFLFIFAINVFSDDDCCRLEKAQQALNNCDSQFIKTLDLSLTATLPKSGELLLELPDKEYERRIRDMLSLINNIRTCQKQLGLPQRSCNYPIKKWVRLGRNIIKEIDGSSSIYNYQNECHFGPKGRAVNIKTRHGKDLLYNRSESPRWSLANEISCSMNKDIGFDHYHNRFFNFDPSSIIVADSIGTFEEDIHLRDSDNHQKVLKISSSKGHSFSEDKNGDLVVTWNNGETITIDSDTGYIAQSSFLDPKSYKENSCQALVKGDRLTNKTVTVNDYGKLKKIVYSVGLKFYPDVDVTENFKRKTGRGFEIQY